MHGIVFDDQQFLVELSLPLLLLQLEFLNLQLLLKKFTLELFLLGPSIFKGSDQLVVIFTSLFDAHPSFGLVSLG
jgi:hypothetical protein